MSDLKVERVVPPAKQDEKASPIRLALAILFFVQTFTIFALAFRAWLEAGNFLVASQLFLIVGILFINLAYPVGRDWLVKRLEKRKEIERDIIEYIVFSFSFLILLPAVVLAVPLVEGFMRGRELLVTGFIFVIFLATMLFSSWYSIRQNKVRKRTKPHKYKFF